MAEEICMTLTERDLTGYETKHTGAVFYRVPDPGYLRITGADRIDFIQRQTTNDARLLKPDRSQRTVLTTPTARMIDVWRLVMAQDAVDVITLPGRGLTTANYLKTRIFFMDKVTVTDASAEVALFEVFGAETAHVASGIELPGDDRVITATVGGVEIRVIGAPEIDGWLLVVPAGYAGEMAEWLAQAGAVALAPAAYDLLRIEAGRPAVGHELTEDYTPLEANLDAAISDSKGCYTGQEVIARQITYDKVTRRLVGLRLSEIVILGATVSADGRSAGTVTSAAESPRFGPIALAVIKRPFFEPGTAVTVGEGENAVHGEVVVLPFG
jgi:folate-binding protein YgfZ